MWQHSEKYLRTAMLIETYCNFASCCTVIPNFRPPPHAYSILRNFPTPCLLGPPLIRDLRVIGTMKHEQITKTLIGGLETGDAT